MAYKNSSPLVKTKQQCSISLTDSNSTQKSSLIDCLIAIFDHITKIGLITDFWRSSSYLHFSINFRAYFYDKNLQIFSVVKISPGLAISTMVFIREVLVLAKCFNSFIDQTGQGTQFSSDMAIFPSIITHYTSNLEPVTYLWLLRYEIAYLLCMTTLMIRSNARKKLQQPIENCEWKLHEGSCSMS